MIHPMSTYNTQSINLSREFAMARFADRHMASAPHNQGSTSALLTGNMGSALDGSRTLAGMLLAAVMAALLVVADQVIETWTDGHLLAGWVVLWTVAFAALALLAPPLRHIAAFTASGLGRRMQSWQTSREEARMWEMASHDPRVVEEIRAAMSRHAA
jgi:hypothetical protein